MRISDVIDLQSSVGFRGRKPGGITKGLNATGILKKAKDMWGGDNNDGTFSIQMEREMKSEAPHVVGPMKFEGMTRTQQMNVAKRMHSMAQQRMRASRLKAKTGKLDITSASQKGKVKEKTGGETQKMFEFLIKNGYKFTQSSTGVQVYENSEGDRFAISTADGHFGHQGSVQEHMGIGLKDLKKQIDTKAKATAVSKIYSKDKDVKAGGPGSGRYPKGSHIHEETKKVAEDYGYRVANVKDRHYSKVLNHPEGSKVHVDDKGKWTSHSKSGKKTGVGPDSLRKHLQSTKMVNDNMNPSRKYEIEKGYGGFTKKDGRKPKGHEWL